MINYQEILRLNSLGYRQRMRERKIFSLAEVKTAVAERLEIINTTPFQKRLGNRREAYLNEEKEFRQYRII